MAQATTDDAQTASEPSLVPMLLRDGAIILIAVSLWAAADTWHLITQLWIAEALAVADAIFVGLILGSLFHEWGHYAGTVASGAKSKRIAVKGASLFRFIFDHNANDTRQFHWMTAGGHILHWGILLLLVFALPLDSLSRISLVSAVFGFVVFATFFEYNIVKDTMAGADPETRLEAVTKNDFQTAGFAGTAAGLFAIALLS